MERRLGMKMIESVVLLECSYETFFFFRNMHLNQNQTCNYMKYDITFCDCDIFRSHRLFIYFWVRMINRSLFSGQPPLPSSSLFVVFVINIWWVIPGKINVVNDIIITRHHVSMVCAWWCLLGAKTSAKIMLTSGISISYIRRTLASYLYVDSSVQ